MRDVLPTLERWVRDGRAGGASRRSSRVERSAPRLPGSVMAVSETGEVAGSVTGGCVESARLRAGRGGAGRRPAAPGDLRHRRRRGLRGGAALRRHRPHLRRDDGPGGRGRRRRRRCATSARWPTSPRSPGSAPGEPARGRPTRASRPTTSRPPPGPLLALGESGVGDGRRRRGLRARRSSRARAMYVFGAIDFASALATVGRFLGYRVTVCDPRAIFVTPERFPDADELVDRVAARVPGARAGRRAHRDLRADPRRRSSTCRRCRPPSRTPARYIGAMGSRRTTERRDERLRGGGGGRGRARAHPRADRPVRSDRARPRRSRSRSAPRSSPWPTASRDPAAT